MKIISIQLFNFRQFYHETPIINFGNGKENTTIIHGNNGSGKTTILNAFTWVLYEEFTGAFNEPKSLINKRAIRETADGESLECYVDIVFEHDFKTYQLKRKFRGYLHKHKPLEVTKTQLFMMVADDDGKWKHPSQLPQDIIEKILPRSLYQYFFFDGEHIDHLLRGEKKQKIAEDTKELIGIKILEQSINHLKKAEKTLHTELTELGDLEIKKLVQEKEKQENKKQNNLKDEKLIIHRLKKLEQEKDKLTQEMLIISGIEKLQQLKQRLLQEEKQLRQQLIDGKQTIKKKISTQGYLVFSSSASQKFQQLINQLKNQEKTPYNGIEKQFIQQLLEQQKCICGHDLIPETDSYKQVDKWQEKATEIKTEATIIRLESRVNLFPPQLNTFWQEINQYKTNLNQWRTKLSEVENKLDDLNEQLRQYPDQNIQQTQKKLDEIEQHIRQLTLTQGEINIQIEEIDEILISLDKQIQKQEIKAEKQKLIVRRITAAQDSIDCLSQVKKRLETQFRIALEKRLQEIFQEISFTPYQPYLSENYEISLSENTAGKKQLVAASTGENQILSLSLIGAIIDMVREWSQQSSLMGLDSSKFPIVMDSPFGSLDEIYRRQVAKSLPQLANQLIVLVTKTQWRNEVEQEMNPYLSKQYILVYHSPKKDCQLDSIVLNNTEYPLVKKSDDQFEYTKIITVEN